MKIDLHAVLAETLAAYPDCVVGVAVERLATRERAAVHGDEIFHPASTIKVALLGALYDLAAQGKLSLDDKVTIHNGFPSSMDNSLFDLKAEDDSEQTLYKRMGETETLRELARLMIVRSSNLGTNLLLEKVPPAAITEYVRKAGAPELLFRNRMMDMKAFEARQTNRASASSLCTLMAKIGRKEVAGAEEMLAVLKGQELNDGIPAGLPKGVAVAHKTGSISRHSHDFGVVYPGDEARTYAVAILTRRVKSDAEGDKLVATVAGKVHGAMMG